MASRMDPPVRPARAGKAPKQESTGLLMSVIRTLSASQNNEERDHEKCKLEKEYKLSDIRLDKLVSEHHQELTVTMQAFSKISSRITASREKAQAVKEKLVTCKMLLHCKRDELKKLWLEAVEHKHVLHMLKEIEGLMEVPEKLDGYMNKKHYLHATQLLVSSVSLLEGSLEGVDALKEMKGKLILKKEVMHEVLVEDLHKHLYVRSTSGVLRQFRRQGSERRSEGIPGTPRKTSRMELSPFSIMYKSPYIIIGLGSGDECIEPLTEDVNAADPEENSHYFIAILVECLALLHKIPETIEIIKERSQRELLAIMRRTAQHVCDNSSQNVVQSTNHLTVPNATQNHGEVHLLFELLELVFAQFHCVANAHQCVLGNLRRIADTQDEHGEIILYEMADIWSKMQSVLEIQVAEYLDIHNPVLTQQPAPPSFSEVTATSDIGSFFARRRNVKAKNFALFRFDSSSHAISMNTYLQEQKEAMREKGEIVSSDTNEQSFVCQPSTKNITVIFKPLMKFTSEIEQILDYDTGNHCPLHAFVSNCVNVYLGQVISEVDNTIESATKSLDSWKVRSEPAILKTLCVTRPLLESTVLLDESLLEFQELILALPAYADRFLHIICTMLLNYKETCQAAYRGIIQPESEDKKIISATWAKDKDISRFLRQLPNWIDLQALKENSDAPDVEESPEEVRLRNMRESDILTSNLTGDTLIPKHEILSDVGQLHILAQLQESLEWFATRILAFTSSLPSQQPLDQLLPGTKLPPSSLIRTIEEIPTVPEGTINSLLQLYKDFEDLADTCLLVLHLEVRVHCFYYLIPVATQGFFASLMESQEPDREVVELNKDLSSIDEAMTASLQPRKLKYIFEGLGHLVASILINSATSLKRINANGVKKMCRNIFALQQNLTSITMSREVALDHARQYFELFYHTPQEILNMIVEHGPQFQGHEYMNALHLIHRSHGSNDVSGVDSQIKKLQEILNEVAVAI